MAEPPSQIVDGVRQRLGQLRAKCSIGLSQGVDDALPGHPDVAGGQRSELSNRSPVNSHAQAFTAFDPAKHLGGVISQLAHGDIATHRKHRST